MKEDKQDDTTNSVLKWGVFSAFIASLCCIGPLALILLGIGGASTALSIGYRKPYFLVFGFLVLAYGFYRLYRKSCRIKHLSHKQQVLIFGGSFVAAALLYYLLTFVLVPLVTPFIYQLRYGS